MSMSFEIAITPSMYLDILFDACVIGDLDSVKELVENDKVDICSENFLAFQLASSHNNTAIFDFLKSKLREQ